MGESEIPSGSSFLNVSIRNPNNGRGMFSFLNFSPSQLFFFPSPFRGGSESEGESTMRGANPLITPKKQKIKRQKKKTKYNTEKKPLCCHPGKF